MSANYIPLCDPFIWEDPRYIFRSSWLNRQHDRSYGGPCASELINHICVVYLFTIVLASVISSFTQISNITLIAGVLSTIYLIPTFMKLRAVGAFRLGGSTVKEGFAEHPPLNGFNDTGVAPGSMDPPRRSSNPFNNVLINELKYSPDRAAAPDITTMGSKIALDDMFRVQWYSDPTDVFGKSQSQREFVTQPSTTIPNDQKSYQDWLYKIPGKTCKEGNPEACYSATSGGLVPWLD